MSFTKDELVVIVSMCKHERTLMDTIESLMSGIAIHRAHAVVAAIAAKASEMREALDKVETKEAVNGNG